MKRTLFCLTFLLLASASAFSQTTKDNTWIEQFKTFRDALYHRDKETVKQFFDFPVTDNQIWDVALIDCKGHNKATENAIKKLGANHSPLTEKLFDLYFDQIFPKEFISSLLKIKTKELYQKEEIEAKELSQDQLYIHRINAQFDKEEKILTLDFTIHPKIQPVDDDSPSGSNWVNANFYFTLIKGRLKFTKISMAG